MAKYFRFIGALLFLLMTGAAAIFLFPARHATAWQQPSPAQSTFLGGWCAQGDLGKRASISYNGAFLNLTNENGDTSIGNFQGSNQITAPGWQFVTGTLSSDGSQINWSNGTFWARCDSGGGGGWYQRPNLNGIWYRDGNRSLSCSIRQHRGDLSFQNENGDHATGFFDGRRHLSTNWAGTQIGGRLSRDGNRIDWDNGSYWMRYRLSSQP